MTTERDEYALHSSTITIGLWLFHNKSIRKGLGLTHGRLSLIDLGPLGSVQHESRIY
jgi:hypothetical protein